MKQYIFSDFLKFWRAKREEVRRQLLITGRQANTFAIYAVPVAHSSALNFKVALDDVSASLSIRTPYFFYWKDTSHTVSPIFQMFNLLALLGKGFVSRSRVRPQYFMSLIPIYLYNTIVSRIKYLYFKKYFRWTKGWKTTRQPPKNMSYDYLVQWQS